MLWLIEKNCVWSKVETFLSYFKIFSLYLMFFSFSTMLEDTLLGIIDEINAWVVSYETGGVMNVLLAPVLSGIGGIVEFDAASNMLKKMLNFIVRMLLYKELDLGVLEVIPETMGGGKRGVDFAHANPNQEPTIFWITVSMFLLILTLIIVLQIINCCCCCCCGQKSVNVSKFDNFVHFK